MATIDVAASAIIDAPPEAVYALLRDYKVGHPAILPKAFKNLVVEEGGEGAGTVFRTTIAVWGKETHYHMEVSEPEPNRLLREVDKNTGQRTDFIFEPLNDGQQTQLTIATYIPKSKGLVGMLESLITPGVTRRVFVEELANIAEYMHKQKA